MRNILVSIIIATFNSEKTLPKALNSVLNQSFESWECVIVDGVSKDGTIDIIKDYCAKDKRFRYISEADNGIYDAFNKGWKMAEGEWIYYLGSDDLLLGEALENFVMNVDESDVIYGNTIFEGVAGQRKIVSIEPRYLRNRMVSHQCIFMKRKCIEELGGFDVRYKICADFALVQKAIQAGAKFSHINYYIAIFNATGVSTRKYSNLFEVYKIREEMGLASHLVNVGLFVKGFIKKFVKLNLRRLIR